MYSDSSTGERKRVHFNKEKCDAMQLFAIHTWSDHYKLHCCIWNENSIIILTIFKVV